LRLRPGDALSLFDGVGHEAEARLQRADGSGVWVDVLNCRMLDRESPLVLNLAQGISAGERMDYTLQKAVELGVAAIQPLAMVRSVVKLAGDRADKRRAHWQGVVVSACAQSGRNRVPALAAPLTLADWLAAAPPPGLRLDPEATLSLADLPPPVAPLWLIAGPEGGFDPRERQQLDRAGWLAVRLGPRVLRTETAALAALAAMQVLWGDLR
jgi:16S rRNA (uracil1498-N3)-methyltransferase